MPNIYMVIDVAVIAALGALGTTVLLQNHRIALNRTFALFVGSISVWILANYISNDTANSPDVAVIANYFVFGFSYIADVLFLRFVIQLTGDEKARKLFRLLIVPIALVGVTAFTPLVVKGVILQKPIYGVEFGPALPLYGVVLLAVLFSGVYVMHRSLKTASGVQRSRISVLFNSLLLTLPVLVLAEFIIPAVTGWFGLTNIGIVPMLILVFGLYYGVVKHRLFDIRLVTVRALAYLLVVGTISLFYVSVSHYVTASLFSESNNIYLNDSLNILLIILIIMAYEPLKRLFNKLTNRLFYRDAYDTQAFLDQFNKALVSMYELTPLLRRSGDIITESLKSDFVAFAIRETENMPRRVVSTAKAVSFHKHDLFAALDSLSDMGTKPIIVDALEGSYMPVRELLLANDIVMVVCLLPPKSKQGIGYLLLGPKMSGNLYSSQDVKVVEILSNELVIAIQNSLWFEEIKDFNKTLQQRIEEATGELRSSNVQLRRLDAAKDEFVSMASHQLRTPLTSVKGYISMVLEGDAGAINPTQRKLLEEAFTSSERMVHLISDFLNVSRLQTGKFAVEKTAINLADLVKQEIDSLVSTADAHSLRLRYRKPAYFPTLYLDEGKIRQVVMNFIDNAIYYSPERSTITVSLAVEDGDAVLTVRDSGIGVPIEQQAHLFTKFFRADNARRQRPDGTGVGLFLAKKVIVAHGGSMVFESVEGEGSTFGFRLPIKKLSEAPAAEPAKAAAGAK